MASRITPLVVVLVALGAGPAWAQGFRSGGSARMPVRAPVQTSQGFGAFNGFGSVVAANQSFGRTPFTNFNTNNIYAATPAGSFAVNTRNAYHPWTGTYTTRVREAERTPFGTATLTTREAYNPTTGGFAYQTRERVNPAFGSPWGSAYSTYQNPYSMNPYGANAYGMNPYGTNAYGMNPYAVNPYANGFGIGVVNPYANLAAAGYGINPQAFAGFSGGSSFNPYPYSFAP